MSDISFYTRTDFEPENAEVSEDIYEWLARSEFSKTLECAENENYQYLQRV